MRIWESVIKMGLRSRGSEEELLFSLLDPLLTSPVTDVGGMGVCVGQRHPRQIWRTWCREEDLVIFSKIGISGLFFS